MSDRIQPDDPARLKAPTSSLWRENALLSGQKRVLEMVATGAPLADTLTELTRFIEAQEDGLHCGVLLVGGQGRELLSGIGPNLPEAYHRALEGVQIAPPHDAPCAEAAYLARAVVVPDISAERRYSDQWRDAVLSNGLATCRSSPICTANGRVVASFAFYYDHPRDPEPTNPELIEMATHLAGIAIERKRSEAALRDSEERLRLVIESATEYAIVTLDWARRITGWNSGAERMLGYAEAEVLGRPGDIFFTPEDVAADAPRKEALIARERGRAADERWHVRKDGSRFWGSGFMMPMAGDDEDAYLKIFHDRTAERQASERQRMLLEELSHRVKNTLAVVQSIASQSLRSGGVDADVRRTFESRLVALAKGHNLLTHTNWQGAEMHDIVAAGLEPFQAKDELRLDIDGPVLSVGPKAALALTMGLHELATNAVKYGALSNESGRVSIVWTVNEADPPVLRLRWQESGGPQVDPPRHKGFGSRLIEQGLAGEISGEVKLEYNRNGVVCTVEAPVSALHDGLLSAGLNQLT